MPDLLSAETQTQRNNIASALTHFLIAQTPRQIQSEAIREKEATAGKRLFHSVGCVACHSPRDESGKVETHEGVVELGHVSAKYSVSSLGEFLFQPMKARPAGRMPDMKLTPIEAKAIASYLIGKGETSAKPLQPQEKLVSQGKKYFQQYSCAT